MEDTTLLFDLHDADGIHSRDPVKLVLASRPDETPIVALRLHGISTAITPEARLPIVGEVHDDYGLTRLWFEYQFDDRNPQAAKTAAKPPTADSATAKPGDAAATTAISLGQSTAAANVDHRARWSAAGAKSPSKCHKPNHWIWLTSLAALGDLLRRHGIKTPDDLIAHLTSLDEKASSDRSHHAAQIDQSWRSRRKLGDRLFVTLKAADNCGLPNGVNIGQGERYQLDIVAPEQLLSMLEGRELMLRRQFEIIYQEMVDTRDGLARIDFRSARRQKASRHCPRPRAGRCRSKQIRQDDSNRHPARPTRRRAGR